jgi:hypothetical protein
VTPCAAVDGTLFVRIGQRTEGKRSVKMGSTMGRIGLLSLAALSLVACSADGASAPEATEGSLATAGCAGQSPDALRERARAFLFSSGLASPADEQDFGFARSQWVPVKVVAPVVTTASSTCLVALNLAMVSPGAGAGGADMVEPGASNDVIAYDLQTKSFKRFEEAVAVPPALQVAFGQQDAREAPSFYYVELAAAGDAWKSILAGVVYEGFSASISAKNVVSSPSGLTGEPDGKATFDPTPNRTWKLRDATYSLRRGLTNETDDVYADQLDADFAAYFSGSTGHVAPWNTMIRRWKLPSDVAWHDIAPPAGPSAQ